MTSKRRKAYRKWYLKNGKKYQQTRKKYRREYYRKNRKKIMRKGILYYRKNRKKILKKVARYNHKFRKNNPEQVSVRSHFYSIVRGYDSTYAGMIFFDGWNPEKGGSIKAGAQWIIENLGKRPKGTQLHIIHHERGFVPGNLEWTYPKKQVNQQMFKIIAQLRHRVKELESELEGSFKLNELSLRK